MPKTTVVFEQYKVTIRGMTHGSYGIDDGGNVFLRHHDSAVCLTYHGTSYTGNADEILDHKVRILQPGDKITIEIE